MSRWRLWLSYQRFALLLFGGSAGVVTALAVWRPGWWWLWGAAALIAIKPVLFGVEVYRRYPRKMRATHVAMRRIQSGRFRLESVRGYCGDPCFRLVAREILARAGVARAERDALIARYQAELKAADDVVLLVDRTNENASVVIRVGGRELPL